MEGAPGAMRARKYANSDKVICGRPRGGYIQGATLHADFDEGEISA